MTGITLTVPTFIDTGGRCSHMLQWDFTNICDAQTLMPCLCVSRGKTDKTFQVFSTFTTVNSSARETCKIKENFRVYLM